MRATKDSEREPRAVAVKTLPEALRLRAGRQPDDLAVAFLAGGEELGETATYGELDRAAAAVAAMLGAARIHDTPVVLMYPPGLEFVRALLGCMYARLPSAPVQAPTRLRGLERVRGIADDAGARVVLTTAAMRDDILAAFGGSPLLDGLDLVATDEPPPEPSGIWQGPPPEPADIALLQYTSGSTGHPKGVMVTHANFMSNVLETDLLWPCQPDGTFVSWLPHFHDMGMLFGIVMPLWAGRPSYLMAPEAFIRRPGRWLEAISRYRGTHSAAPSFAYELCAREAAERGVDTSLDLSSWRVAANGAEPVRWSVIEAFAAAFAPAGFRPEAMCPGYGLAENTLKATGSPPGQQPTVLWTSTEALERGRIELLAGPGDGATPLVGCGVVVAETRLRVVEPETRTQCPPGRVGEIWISGPCVAEGYWEKTAETRAAFHATLAGQPGEGSFLRTGDLGFLHGGELFVAGRLKDVIIRKGRNFYPQDIELSAESVDPGLHPNCAAAFSVDDGDRERLVVVVEADGRVLRSVGADALCGRIREAVHDGQRLDVEDVVVVRRGSIPKTSSGKVQRRACRQRYLEGTLALVPSGGVRS